MSNPVKILYTRPMVEFAAEDLGQRDLADRYFQGLKGAYETVDSVLKDATFEQESA